MCFRSDYMTELNIIHLWGDIWTNCVLCRVDILLGLSAPMYEGKVVDPSKTDDWAGQPVCKLCYKKIFGV